MKRLILLMSALVLVSSCNLVRPKWSPKKKGGGGEGPNAGNVDPDQIPGTMGTSQAGLNLVWKRYRAFESGLADGLSLKREETCLELGKHKCVDEIHLAILGGNEPFELAQYERPQSPSVLTAVAVDRIVLAACAKRLELDRAAGKDAQVFKFFPLSGGTPDGMQVQMQAAELYQRFLARDPEAAELQVVSAFVAKQNAPDKLALSLCFAIGTSIENIFL